MFFTCHSKIPIYFCKQSRGIPKEGKSEADEIIKRLRSHPGIYGVIVSNKDGIAIRTTLENRRTVHYCGLIQGLMNKSTAMIKDLDPANDLTFLRIRSKKYEIMVAPQRDLLLIVIQKAVFDLNMLRNSKAEA